RGDPLSAGVRGLARPAGARGPRQEAPPARRVERRRLCGIVQQSRPVARSSILIAAVLFGTTGTAQALGPAGLSPLSVGAARVVIGGGILGLLALAVARPRPVARLSPMLVVC